MTGIKKKKYRAAGGATVRNSIRCVNAAGGCAQHRARGDDDDDDDAAEEGTTTGGAATTRWRDEDRG
jgi:hypothetical protein